MKKVLFICSVLMLLTLNSVFGRMIVCLNFGDGKWHCNVLEGNCSRVGGAGMSTFGDSGGNWLRYCVQLLPIKPPIIWTLENGSAFLDNNGQITQIASDKTKRFFENADKMTSKERDTFLKTDNGIVSQKRLKAIAKELGAKIVKSKNSITANYCPACEEK